MPFSRLATALRGARVPALLAGASFSLHHSLTALSEPFPSSPSSPSSPSPPPAPPPPRSEPPAPAPWHRADAASLPTFTLADVAAHTDARRGGVWLTFGGAVYDITPFLASHPGGVDKLLTAAGRAVEPFWALYRQHLAPGGVPKPAVAELLAPLQIGWLDAASAAAAADAAAASRDADDPYAAEPARHPALLVLSETPCSAECPPSLLGDSWLTPNALWFVRHHHPVPRLDEQSFTLEVSGVGLSPRSFTLAELRAMPRVEVAATLQCGGNRRAEFNRVAKTSGNAWGAGAMSNALWGGVRLSHVLRECGLDLNDAEVAAKLRHVHFEGEDGTKASIPSEKALAAAGDVLLAYEMNGEAVPADHGFPLRVVVPGHVGVRNIKWLRKVTTAEEEAEGMWQRGMAYKVFNPSVRSLDGVDVEKYAAMQEMPVTSVVLSPLPGATLDADETVSVRGLAWSGGGRGIVRVDVSADGGSTWHSAELTEGADQPPNRAWAWTFWEAELPLPAAQRAEIVCKATDVAHNVQPESVEGIWNLRGLANNSWHRVPVEVKAAA